MVIFWSKLYLEGDKVLQWAVFDLFPKSAQFPLDGFRRPIHGGGQCKF